MYRIFKIHIVIKILLLDVCRCLSFSYILNLLFIKFIQMVPCINYYFIVTNSEHFKVAVLIIITYYFYLFRISYLYLESVESF